MTKRIFSLNQFITTQLSIKGYLSDVDINAIKTWASEIDGKEVEPTDKTFTHGNYSIQKEWTKEVEC